MFEKLPHKFYNKRLDFFRETRLVSKLQITNDMQAGSSLTCRLLQINQRGDEADKWTSHRQRQISMNRSVFYVTENWLMSWCLFYNIPLYISGVRSNAPGCVWFIRCRYAGSFLVSSNSVAFIALLFACWRRLRVLRQFAATTDAATILYAVMNCNMLACGTPPPTIRDERLPRRNCVLFYRMVFCYSSC